MVQHASGYHGIKAFGGEGKLGGIGGTDAELVGGQFAIQVKLRAAKAPIVDIGGGNMAGTPLRNKGFRANAVTATQFQHVGARGELV